MKIVSVVGARPQFIKAAPVSRALARAGLSECLVHTGQHYDQSMSGNFFEELNLKQPDHHLGIGSGSHGRQTGLMLEAIETALTAERPDWLLVYGDTNSTLAAALAAAKLHIPIAHVEAGARSYNRTMPEEINRVVTDHVSTLLLAASDASAANLRREGIAESAIVVAGDVMHDAVLMFSAEAERQSNALARLGLASKSFALATIHRAENTDRAERLHAIFRGLTDLTTALRVVLPLHPRTLAALDRETRDAFTGAGGILIEPAGYFDMMQMERHAALIITDSGGVQKEAFYQQVPCLTIRDETEWTELVELGWNTLLPPEQVDRLREVALAARARKGVQGAPYGDGRAADIIVRSLREHRR